MILRALEIAPRPAARLRSTSTQNARAIILFTGARKPHHLSLRHPKALAGSAAAEGRSLILLASIDMAPVRSADLERPSRLMCKLRHLRELHTAVAPFGAVVDGMRATFEHQLARYCSS